MLMTLIVAGYAVLKRVSLREIDFLGFKDIGFEIRTGFCERGQKWKIRIRSGGHLSGTDKDHIDGSCRPPVTNDGQHVFEQVWQKLRDSWFFT